MSLVIHLLGRPRMMRGGEEVYQFRSRKSWALLAYLILSERPPTRSQAAALLFAEADDPIRALRWNLSELRRGLGQDTSIEGDPLTLALPANTIVDINVVTKGAWTDAVALPALGADLLEGMRVYGAPAFDTWLLAQQRHFTAASEAILHEAALSLMSRGELNEALDYAVRAAAMNPLDENHQALVIRLYRLAGDDAAAQRQFAACIDTLDRELGVAPGPSLRAAMRENRYEREEVTDDATIEAILEAGSAAISAGAREAGLQSLHTAVRLADSAAKTSLRVSSRLVLAEALIHSFGGMDEQGLALLYEVDEIAVAHDLRDAIALTRAELGYVDFLRAQYDRAELRLSEALKFADGSPSVAAKATIYLGAVESDRANYRRAFAFLRDALTLSRAAGEPRREAYGLAMLGRINLLQENFEAAASQLDDSIQLAERAHWLAFLPWPQALQGEVRLGQGDIDEAAELLNQAFARACLLGDPCWEGMSARGLALLSRATGQADRAFEILADATDRCSRLNDTYIWLRVYILDARCELGRGHGHPDTRTWVDTMQALASRTGMKELTVRSLLHGAALDNPGDAAAARLLAVGIDNPALDRLVAARVGD